MPEEVNKDIIEIIKTAIQEKDELTIKIISILLISFIFLSLITNLVIPLVINLCNRKNEITKIKIERKLDFFEKLFKTLKLINSSLSILDINTITAAQKNINSIRTQIFVSSYLVTKKMKKTINELLDYFTDVLNDSYKRNTEKEDNLFLKLVKEYENIK